MTYNPLCTGDHSIDRRVTARGVSGEMLFYLSLFHVLLLLYLDDLLGSRSLRLLSPLRFQPALTTMDKDAIRNNSNPRSHYPVGSQASFMFFMFPIVLDHPITYYESLWKTLYKEYQKIREILMKWWYTVHVLYIFFARHFLPSLEEVFLVFLRS